MDAVGYALFRCTVVQWERNTAIGRSLSVALIDRGSSRLILTAAFIQKSTPRVKRGDMSRLTSPLTRKLSAVVALSDADLTILTGFHQRRKTFLPGDAMVIEGQTKPMAFILADGWACSYKRLPDGGRQIVDIQVPGDFLGLRNILFRTADYNIEAVTRLEASVVLSAEIQDGFAKSPRLTAALLWAASRDEAMLVEHLVNVGRRSAEERMGHFLLEIGARLRLVGLGDNLGYDCPLTQSHLADVLGLTAVHVNRVLRKLREHGLVTFRNGHVTFDGFDGLKNFAGFEMDYLDHPGPLLRWGT